MIEQGELAREEEQEDETLKRSVDPIATCVVLAFLVNAVLFAFGAGSAFLNDCEPRAKWIVPFYSVAVGCRFGHWMNVPFNEEERQRRMMKRWNDENEGRGFQVVPGDAWGSSLCPMCDTRALDKELMERALGGGRL